MYGNILLVGGGLLFEGVESLLQYRVWLNLPPQYQSAASVNVLTRSKVSFPWCYIINALSIRFIL